MYNHLEIIDSIKNSKQVGEQLARLGSDVFGVRSELSRVVSELAGQREDVERVAGETK